MSESVRLPVLPLDDEVVVPGMVVPLDLSDGEVRAAVEAARAGGAPGKPRVLLVPRIDGRYTAIGTIAVIEQEGRLPGGGPGAGVRGAARVRIGTGTTGPGAALWAEAVEIDAPDGGPRAEELGQKFKVL